MTLLAYAVKLGWVGGVVAREPLAARGESPHQRA
jgi:hypothetical protein